MRARGTNAVLLAAIESEYGIVPSSGYFKLPFTSWNLGDEQNLVEDDLLGEGRDPADPSLDVINNDGDVGIPVDVRNIGMWLKLLLGAPTTTAGLAAEGSIAFSSQPTSGTSITVNGTEFSFGSDIEIGDSLRETVENAVTALNASTVSGVAAATYETSADGKSIEIVHDTIGTAGNSFTLVAESGSNATVSGATLTGGAATGAYNHIFTSGNITLPSMAAEVGMPDAEAYALNYGIVADKLTLPFQRSGNLGATMSCIAKGEQAMTSASSVSNPTTLAIERFTQFTGKFLRSGVPLGDLVSGNLVVNNSYDKVEILTGDGRIGGADPGAAKFTGQDVVRFKDTVLMDLASNGEPIDISHRWKISAAKKLTFMFHRVFLPKPKLPISGPGGVQATYNWQGAKSISLGHALTVTLVNDVATY